MTDRDTQTQPTQPRPSRGRPALAGVALALAAVALLVAPAAGNAATKFGAKLGGNPNPVAWPEFCPDEAGYCTRAPLNYEDPTHAGIGPHAPHDGVVDKIKLVSAWGSLFIPQVVKVRGNVAPITELKVKEQGPTLIYAGTGDIETFDVDLPIKQGERIAMRTQFAGALQCEPGIDNEAIADPLLLPSNVFTDANYYTGCTHLVQAVMED
jgi:hypothetical protein